MIENVKIEILSAGGSAMVLFNSEGNSGIVTMASSNSQPEWVLNPNFS